MTGTGLVAVVTGRNAAARLHADDRLRLGERARSLARLYVQQQPRNVLIDGRRQARLYRADHLATVKIVEVLARSAVFENVAAGDLKVLAMMFERRELTGGEILCRAGERADSVFAVSSGEIEVYLPGSATPVTRKGPGDVIGEYGMFLSAGRSATLRASGPTSVLTLDYEHFKRFLLAFPQSTLSLLDGLVNKYVRSELSVRSAKHSPYREGE